MIELTLLSSSKHVARILSDRREYRAALGHEPTAYLVCPEDWKHIQAALARYNKLTRAGAEKIDGSTLTLTLGGVPVRRYSLK